MLYLRLLVAALFASVRARRDLVLEHLALRHQLAVCTRGPSSTAAPSPRPPMLVTAGTRLVRLARHARDGRAGHGGAVAAFCLARLLALEESSRTGASPHSRRVAAADPAQRH